MDENVQIRPQSIRWCVFPCLKSTIECKIMSLKNYYYLFIYLITPNGNLQNNINYYKK